MTIACKKHQKEPVVGYSPCPGCEVERLRNEIEGLSRQRDNLIKERDELWDKYCKVSIDFGRLYDEMTRLA